MTTAIISARATEMLAALPVVTSEGDTIPLGELCCVCVERPKAGGDNLCAQCRTAFWYWERWTGEKEREK